MNSGLAGTVEPTQEADEGWVAFNAELVRPTLFETADTWYMGANIPDKPRVFMPHLGFVGPYRAKCDEVVANDYVGDVVLDDGSSYRLPRVPVQFDERAPHLRRAPEHEAEWRAQSFLFGSVDEVVRDLRRWHGLGVHGVMLQFLDADDIAGIELVAREVLPALA